MLASHKLEEGTRLQSLFLSWVNLSPGTPVEVVLVDVRESLLGILSASSIEKYSPLQWLLSCVPWRYPARPKVSLKYSLGSLNAMNSAIIIVQTAGNSTQSILHFIPTA